MRALWIDDKGISELDIHPDWECRSDISWDAFDLTDTHDGWTDDVGLFRPNPLIATFGDGRQFALPVLVLGRDGERSVDATMTLAELGAMVTLDEDPAGR
jgi:hypothetical protein